MEDQSVPTPQMPETEVSADPSAPSSKRSAPPRAKRRRFSQAYKRKMVEQYGQLGINERGALLIALPDSNRINISASGKVAVDVGICEACDGVLYG